MEIPSWDELFIRQVYLSASKSKDPRTKIGSVIVRDRNCVSTGFNGFPIGVMDLEERYNNRETKLKLVSHAESNSILFAARFGISTLGCKLYTQGIPCNFCAKQIIQCGISEIIIHKQWPNLYYSKEWMESFKITNLMFIEANIKVREFDKKLGINGFLDGKEIEV